GGVPAAFRPTGGVTASLPVTIERFGYLLAVGYYQLYFLVLLLELYVLYPAFLWLLRRTTGHHRALLGASLALQALSAALVHWGVVPGWMSGAWATRELWNYQLFVVAGGLMAWHYEAVHAWIRRRWRLVLIASVLSTALGEGWYLLARGPLPGL